MIYFSLFYEFAKVAVFTFGGGMASIPFLQDMAVETGWFTLAQLTDFIAVSESTPGPIAVNIATYAGYNTAGYLGGVCATMGLVFPAIVLMTIVAKFITAFRGNKYIDRAFYGLRPCVLALIMSALIGIAKVTLLYEGATLANLAGAVNIRACLIFATVVALQNVKKFKKLHPVIFLALSAVLGIVMF
ncbi:MAG: chromate transporter [Oscillospiraceae bacterium]|nr:chromate transporter [Oscillospiraceae bacterium]